MTDNKLLLRLTLNNKYKYMHIQYNIGKVHNRINYTYTWDWIERLKLLEFP
jgi:hypothetical protein